MNDYEIRVIIPATNLVHALNIRKQVFQQEQKISELLDFDGQDDKAIHIVVYANSEPIGTARIRFFDNKQKAKIERVAVLSLWRGRKIGGKILEYINRYLEQVGVKEAYLDSQEHAKAFYEKAGYYQKGEIFEEVGISHVKMVKKIYSGEPQEERQSIIAAIAIIFNSENEILLSQRYEPENKQIHGKWQFPGGGVEFGEDPKQTVIREVREEVSISIKLLSEQPFIYSNAKETYHIILLGYPAVYISGDIDISGDSEGSDAKWFSYEEIDFENSLKGTKELIDQAIMLRNPHLKDLEQE